MNDSIETKEASIIEQIQRVFTDLIDYAASQATLFQARATEMVLSSAAFIALVFLCLLAMVAAVVLGGVALGLWLAHVTGSAAISVLILGGVFLLLAGITGGVAIRWLNRLKS